MGEERKQIARVLTMIDIIDGVRLGITAEEIHTSLADRGFDVHKRTVARDLELLQKLGYPLEEMTSDDRSVRFRFKSGTRINQFLAVSDQELWALHLLHMLTRQMDTSATGKILRDFFRKIEDKLGHQGRSFLNELTQTQSAETVGAMQKDFGMDVLETLRAACAEEQVVQVNYASANSGTVKQRRLGPQFLFFAKNSFYLVAEDLDATGTKTFAVSRMSTAIMLDEHYSAPTAVDPEGYFAASFGIFRGEAAEDVELRFNAQVTPFIQERRWHPSQEIIAESNGSCRLILRVAVTPDLIRWILGWGAAVEVLGSETLREKVREEAASVERIYLNAVKHAG